MTAYYHRRVTALESRIPPVVLPGAVDPARRALWLKTISDDDLDLLEHVAEHIESGGTLDDMNASARIRLPAVLATWADFDSAHVRGRP